MEALFKKYFWVIRLVGLAAVVAFAASAMSTQVGVSCLFVDDATTLGQAEEDPEDEDGEEDPSKNDAFMRSALNSMGSGGGNKDSVAENIVKNNPFCPTCAPVEPTEQGSGPVRPGEIKSSLPLELLATMEADDPLYSLATIRDTELNTLGPYELQDELRPGVTIHEIGRGRVVLRNGAQLEFIEMGAEPPPPPKEKKKKKDDADKKKNKNAIEGAEEAIDCKGDTCTVDREFVEGILNNPGLLAKQARVVPAIKDGETRGFKFYGIRPGSLPKLLGLKNGDLLTNVNGNDLTSLDQAMGLYTKLRRASHLSVTLERKGKTIQKEVDIK
jgi:general secretion pathway protein C